MEKKNYINNIIQACNKVLEYEKLVNDLGGSIEELFWDIADPESVENELAEHWLELEYLICNLYRFRVYTKEESLPESIKNLFVQTNSIANDIFDLHRENINHIKKMSSEDVLAIRSIMGQVKLLRDTLIWASDGDKD